MKRASPEHGNIRVQNVGRGLPYPQIEGWRVIPAWSRGAEPWKALSPFCIGHTKDTNFECYWQSHKVWDHVNAQKAYNWSWPAQKHLDEDGNPNADWYKWHEALKNHKYPVRRPNGRAKPQYAWWNGEKLGVVEARKQIYIPELQKLYRDHPVYQRLLEEVRGGQNIILLEPDGYPGGKDVDLDSLVTMQDQTEIKGKYFPYGHGYVIALTILEDLQK